MIKKKGSLGVLTILAVAFSLFIAGCSHDSGVTSGDSSVFDTEDYQIAQPQPINEIINDMTMSREMEIVDPTVITCNPEDNRLAQELRPSPGRDVWTLGRILKRLDLSSDQVSQIRSFVQSHKDCVDGIYQELRQSERLILQNANDKRNEILQNLKDSVITPEVARNQIKRLAEATRTELLRNPARTRAIAAIKDCRETLLTNIESILTQDQLTNWRKLLAKIR